MMTTRWSRVTPPAKPRSLRMVFAAFLLAALPWSTHSARAQGNRPVEPIKVEIVTLHPDGFDPPTWSPSSGRFLLALDNRTRLASVTLRLDKVAGNRLREVAMPRGRMKWREILDLPPGDYVLTEASHPAWTCRLTVAPH